VKNRGERKSRTMIVSTRPVEFTNVLKIRERHARDVQTQKENLGGGKKVSGNRRKSKVQSGYG